MRQNVYLYSYSMRQERKSRVLVSFSVTVGVILFVSLFLNFILFPCLVKSDSMESDIVKNSAVFVTPLDRTPKRGEVFYLAPQVETELSWYKKGLNTVIRFFTFQQYAPFGYNRKFTQRNSIRRIIALPGDTIYIQDYIVYIKPEGQNLFLTEFELSSRPYNIHIYSVPAEWDFMGASGNMKETVLKEDEYFVLADNRLEAVDSRLYGPVSKNKIRGRVLMEFFPFNKIRFF